MFPRVTLGISGHRRHVAALSASLTLALSGCSAGVEFEHCRTTADCLDRGMVNALCTPQHYCLQITNNTFPNCPMVLGGDITSDSTVIGFLTKRMGQSQSLGLSAERAAALALDDLQVFGAGVQMPPGRRPTDLRILSCDDGVDSAESVQVAKYLINTLGLPALMGPVFSGPSVDVAQQVTIPSGALMLNPIAVTPLLTALQDKGLVWRTSSSNAIEPIGMTMLVSQLDTYLHAPQGGLMEPLRVVAIARPEVYGRGIVNEFSKSLRLGGGDRTPGASQLRVFELTKTATGYSFDNTAAVKDFAPHVVVMGGTGEMITEVIEKLENSGLSYPPHYIGSEGMRLQDLITYVANRNNKMIHKRVQIFAPSIRPDYYSALAQRWSAHFKELLPDLYGVANTYDAVYLLAYSLATLGTSEVTGPSLANGLSKMGPPGIKIQAGPDSIVKAYQTIVTAGHIDYDGVVGPLDFDANGEAPGTFDVLCMAQDGGTWNFRSSGTSLSNGTSGPQLSTTTYQPCK